MNARPEQILYAVRHMGLDSLADMQQLTWFDDVMSYALERAAGPGPKWAYTLAGVVLAVGGFVLAKPGVATAWIISTPELTANRMVRYDLLRLVRAIVKRALGGDEIRRIEASARENWPEAVAFVEHAGLKREGRHPGMCTDGSAVISFGLTKGEHHHG